MAGNNQSVNLGGMLSQIGGTLGSMGKTAGEAFGKNITNMSKPEVDPKDPQSVRNYASWLQSRGDEAAAMRYLQMADKLDAENKTMVAMASSQEANEKASLGAQQGDVRFVQEQINRTRENLKRAAAEKDVDGVRVYQAQMQQLNQMLPGAQEAAATKKVSGALKYEKMLADGTRMDPETGKPVPLTEEQKSGLSAHLETMLEDPDTRKGYVSAKVQEDQVDRMQQDQVDEQLIAAGSQAIFGAASPEEAEAALEKALESPDVSPKARQSLVQMANTKVTALDKATARKERAAELNTPVITKEDRESFRETLSSLPEDSPVAKQLATAFKSVEEAQDKITSGGTGFATKSAREALARRFNGLQNQAMNLAFAEDSANRQAEAAENRKNAGIYIEAQANAALGPRRVDVTELMKASEDSGENYTYEQAKAVLQADLNSKVERIRPLVAPEDQAKITAFSDAEKGAISKVVGSLAGEYETDNQKKMVATFMIKNNKSEEFAVEKLKEVGRLPKTPESVMQQARSNQPLGKSSIFSNTALRPRGF